MRNYTPLQYGAHSQNWAIVQDRRGVMYFGNTSGILEYDGVTWRKIALHGSARIVFSLAIDSSGVIYAGSFNELGYLAPDSTGRLQYISLLDRIDKQYHECGPVWEIYATGQGVFFRTPKYIFLVSSDTSKVWKAKTSFRFSFFIRGEFYVVQGDVGLSRLVGNSLQAIADQKSPNDVVAMLPYGDRRILIVRKRQGMLLYDGLELEPFPRIADEVISGCLIDGGVILPDGAIALSTILSGVLIFNRDGELRMVLDKSVGLGSNFIHRLFVDREGELWIATNEGISRVEIPSPVTVYDARLGLEGRIQKTVRHQGVLYTATNIGVYYLAPRLDERGARGMRFKRIKGINSQCWDLLSVGKSLLVATSDGVYNIRNKVATPVGVTDDYSRGAFALRRSKQDTNRVFVGLRGGLAAQRFTGVKKGWIDEGRINGIEDRIRWIAEGEDGALWLCTPYEGVLRITFPLLDAGTSNERPDLHNASIQRYDTTQGLPAMGNNHVYSFDRQVYFATLNGVFIFDSVKQRFVPDKVFGKSLFGDDRQIFRMAESRQHDMWFVGSDYDPSVALRQRNGSYRWEYKQFLRYKYLQTQDIYTDDKTVWIGGKNGLIRYQAAVKKNYRLDFAALIRKVSIDEDSVIYGGYNGAAVVSGVLPVSTGTKLDYANNALKFEYAAPFFDEESAIRFQYFLEGFDEDWSGWTADTKKEYTNLPEGDYRFRVRARNVYEQQSSEGQFAFAISPPWFRTWPAYGAYLFLFAGFVLGLVKWRFRKHEKEKQALEQIIVRRTKEIAAKNSQLKEQAETLKEMDHLKSRFFTNISHEFRTPLTLIIDPLREMMSGSFKGDVMVHYRVMFRNARRLLRLINQLLDISKLESGMMFLSVGRYDLIAFLRAVVSSFESQAARRNIHLRFEEDNSLSKVDKPLMWYFDRERMEQVLVNILSNAFKFTSEYGEIVVTLSMNPDGIVITVRDTGTGIPSQHLPYVFDRFYMAEDTTSRANEGTGIGLALTKELVHLHHGEINVRSEWGRGTEFSIFLPEGKSHFHDQNIAEKPQIENVVTLDEDLEIKAGEERTVDHRGRSGKKTMILVVEDNDDVRFYIRQYLEPAYRVEEASDGLEGLKAARELLPDLIISDVMMPNMNGYELCRVIKNDITTSHIPLILLTAKASDDHKIEGLETGADDYLIKPFNARELLARVKNLIAQRKQLQQKYRRDYLLKPAPVSVLSMDDTFLRRAWEMVEQNMSDPDFNIEHLSDALSMTRSNLHRKIRALTGQTPSQFTRSIRLKRAAELLAQKSGTVTEIAYNVGFSSSAYFSRCFREQFGVPPNKYRDDK
ncbi:MAG: response regulator [Chlorobi bacterium]|nr:response regulator [Chlorobiota bacterium]